MPEPLENSQKRLSPLGLLAVGFVRAYQLFISPLIPPRCRYMPTCSSYAIQAIRVHGGLKGGWLAIKRVARCHPWGGHGYDPVPDASDKGHHRHDGNCKRTIEAGDDRHDNQGVSSHG